MNLPFVSEDDGLHAIARDVVAADLHLRYQIFVEPEVKQRIVEIFPTRGEGVAVDS